MTTLNPSHDFTRKSEGRHAQAVRTASSYPDDLPVGDDESIDEDGPSRAKKEGRKRVRQQMPPMPDLRFEQVSQISLLVMRASKSRCQKIEVADLPSRTYFPFVHSLLLDRQNEMSKNEGL